jgi:hypothetical protein
MENNTNNVPTGPGWWYRRKSSPITPIEIVLVSTFHGALIYWAAGYGELRDVENDGLWLGPVPMPGKFAPMCDQCNGRGWYMDGPEDDPQQIQCDPCYGVGYILPTRQEPTPVREQDDKPF